MDTYSIINAVEEAKLLGLFKSICEKNDTTQSRKKLRNIYGHTQNSIQTTKSLMMKEFGVDLGDNEAKRMSELIVAFLDRKQSRETIPIEKRKELLFKQNGKCAICACDIDIKSHVDHIVPFKYVGDELKDNLQMLCSKCNLEKSASIDYQIRHLLNLV